MHPLLLKKTGKSLLYPNNEDGFIQMVSFYEQFRAKCTYDKIKSSEVGCTKSMYPGMRLRSTIQIRPMVQLKKAICMKKCKSQYFLICVLGVCSGGVFRRSCSGVLFRDTVQ